MLARNILLGIGILALVIGAVLAVVWFRQSPETAAQTAAKVPPQSILSAARKIPAGTLLRTSDVVWRDVPATTVVPGNVTHEHGSEAQFVGSVARRDFAAGEALAVDAFVKPGDHDFLVATLAPGFRAVSIAVDAAQSASGLMLPGDRVDVVLTQTFTIPVGGDPGQRSVAETVLHDLRIIAVDQTLSAEAKSPEIKTGVVQPEIRFPKMITLEVREEQAEMLLVAGQLGKVQLTLRGQSKPGATPVPDTIPPTWASDVSSALEKLETIAPASEKGHEAIEVFHGSKIERRCPTAAGLVVCP